MTKPWESPFGRPKEKSDRSGRVKGHLYGAEVNAGEFGVLISRAHWPSAYACLCESRMRWINYGPHPGYKNVVVNFYNERDASAFRLIFAYPTTLPDTT